MTYCPAHLHVGLPRPRKPSLAQRASCIPSGGSRSLVMPQPACHSRMPRKQHRFPAVASDTVRFTHSRHIPQDDGAFSDPSNVEPTVSPVAPVFDPVLELAHPRR